MQSHIIDGELAWKKVLYKRQPFPDEYSGGAQFLKDLRKNVSVVEYTYFEAVCGAGRVMLHANAIIIYIIVFEALQRRIVHSFTVFTVFFLISLSIYIVFVTSCRVSASVIADHSLTFIALLSFGYALTPVIRTLTDTISTDTIYAMAALLFLASFPFHDYAVEAPIVSMVLSGNLCLAASVCLVSRVSSNEIAFGLLSISTALFSYWSHLRNMITSIYPAFPIVLLTVLFPMIFTCLFYWSFIIAFLFLLLHIFVILVCPWILMLAQPMKSTINGPWDEATPSINYYLTASPNVTTKLKTTHQKQMQNKL